MNLDVAPKGRAVGVVTRIRSRHDTNIGSVGRADSIPRRSSSIEAEVGQPPLTRPAALALALLASLAAASSINAAQVTINGPTGSGVFGARVTILPNGNFVVIDNEFDAGPVPNVGAVYLYRADGVLISTLQGSSPNDQVGNGGVTVLSNGNYVIRSGVWRNGAVSNAGAVTFASGSAGVEGVVSASNSLVGTAPGDAVGSGSVTALSNGNYVVSSPLWNLGAVADVGAVTWGSGTTGVSGAVSAINSLVGGRANDQIGASVVALDNGNYVVPSPVWDNGLVINAGAATFGLGMGGLVGSVSIGNSLVGSTADDSVGIAVRKLDNGNYVVQSPNWDKGSVVNAGAASFASGVNGITGIVSASNSLVGDQNNDQVGLGTTLLSNGNYVVQSPQWRNAAAINAGAITFASGVTGVAGSVNSGNSLVGGSVGDAIGSLGVTALSNGGYVVVSPLWNNGAIADAGAVSFGPGTAGISGLVSSSNSLVGGQANDQIGAAGVMRLANGSYVVRSPSWDSGAVANVGASTFGSGVTGVNGIVSSINSLIGSTAGDGAESTVTALSNGHYVVSNWRWDNGAAVDAGAATWGSGITGTSGVISASNSLVGITANDRVGSACVRALANGNYVVCSPGWDNAGISNAGAATFASGSGGLSGPVSPNNSLTGSLPDDQVGVGALALSTGDYVVLSPFWDAGTVADAGAATFASGIGGMSGEISALNSLVGSAANDQLGSTIGLGGSVALANGHYVVRSPFWNSGFLLDAGAVTLGLADGSVFGPITDTHSVIGAATSSGPTQTYAHDPLRNQLIVGDQSARRIVLHRPGIATSISIAGDTPDPSGIGESVELTAVVSTTLSAPNNGRVTFSSSSGATCTDTTPTSVSAQAASFSCSLTFNTVGTFSVQAEYTGSLQYAYSGIAVELHTVGSNVLFGDGFE